jgi:hypothetical protein
MHRTIIAVLFLSSCALLGCTRSEEPPQRKPQQAGQAIDPTELAARIVAARAAATVGDQ